MDRVTFFKNFNLGTEIDLAGAFAYNALSILNTENNVYQNDQIFLFLYNSAVSVERMQKCVLFLFEDYNESNFSEFESSLKSHNYQNLQGKIFEKTKKKLSAEQNALLKLLSEFYSNGRYSNYSLDDGTRYDYKAQFEAFIKDAYSTDFVDSSILDGISFITERAKERIGRTLGKLLCYYYDLIWEKAHELQIFTYELRSDSAAEKVLMNSHPNKSLQSIHQDEKNALSELIVYLANTPNRTGYLNLLRSFDALDLDPFLVQDYLPEILNGQIPQELVDEVETIYADLPPKEVSERRTALSALGERNLVFPEDEEGFED